MTRDSNLNKYSNDFRNPIVSTVIARSGFRDEAISLPGKVGDCFCKERLGMTPGLVDFQNSFDDLHICTVLGMMGWCNITNEEIKRA